VRWWAESGSGLEMMLAAHDRVERFPNKLNPIFYLIEI
jgi:hypothetical protein